MDLRKGQKEASHYLQVLILGKRESALRGLPSGKDGLASLAEVVWEFGLGKLGLI